MAVLKTKLSGTIKHVQALNRDGSLDVDTWLLPVLTETLQPEFS